MAMHKTDIDLSMERTHFGGVANVENVVNRLHTVRSSMREHSASNEALLAAIASMVADGKSASKAGLEEAMRGFERQRKETLDAREEARRANETLLVMESELVTVETTRRELAHAQEALARLKVEYDTEVDLRTNMKLQIDAMTRKVESASRDAALHDEEMERLCSDLMRAEEERNGWEQKAKALEIAAQNHESDQLAVWETLSKVMAVENFVENAVNKAARAAQQMNLTQTALLSKNESLSLQVDKGKEKIKSLGQELDSVKDKNKQLSAQVKRLSNAAGSGEEDITRLQVEITQLENQHSLLKEKQRDTQKIVDSLRSELQDKENKLSSSAKDLDAFECCLRNISHSSPQVGQWRINELGLTIACTGGATAILSALTPGGPGAQCAMLSTGDSLLQVNDRDISKMSLLQIQKQFKGTGNITKLTVRHATKGTNYVVSLNKETCFQVSPSVTEQIKDAYKVAEAWQEEFHSMRGHLEKLDDELGISKSSNAELLSIQQSLQVLSASIVSDLKDSIKDSHKALSQQRAELESSSNVRDEMKRLQAQLQEEIEKQQRLQKEYTDAEGERARESDEAKSRLDQAHSDLNENEQRNARLTEHLRHQRQRAEEAEAKLLRSSVQITERSQDSAAAYLQLEHISDLHHQALEDLEATGEELERKQKALSQSTQQLVEAVQGLQQVHEAVCRSTDAQYCGVGLCVAVATNTETVSPSKQLVVEALVAGGAAAACGDFVEGDPILQIGGKNVQGLSVSEVHRMLLGSAGSHVEVSAQRGAAGARYRVTLVRSQSARNIKTVSELALEAGQGARLLHTELAEGRVEMEQLREEVKKLKGAVAEVQYWEGRFKGLEVS